MTNPKNDKNIYKVFNNVQYRLLDNKENFSHVVNMALGKEATTPSTLHSCDSREIALISKATEKAIQENEENEVVRESLLKLSKELFRDIKKANIKKDGKCIYLCIENQSINRKDVKARIHLYNALSYLTAIDKDGYTIPVITVLVLWGRDEGWRDTSAFNFRKEHIKDYLEFLPVYSIPTISILDLNEEEKEKGREDGKQEGISIGEKRGISIGENKRILKCILGFQKKAKCSFDEAADALGVSKETLEQLKTSGLV